MDYPPVEMQNSILSDLLGIESLEMTLWMKTASLILIIYQVIYITRISSVNNILHRHPMFSGIIYVLILSVIPDIPPVNTLLIGNTFLIIAIFQILQVIYRNQRSKRIFNTGFLLSLAVLCNINFIYLVPFFIIAANSMIVVHRKEFILYILGFLIPVYFLWAHWFLTDNLKEGIVRIENYFHWFDYPFIYQNYGLIKAGIVSLLVLFCFMVFNRIVSRQNIFVRNKLFFIFYLLIYSFFIIIVNFHVTLDNLQTVFVPLAFLLGLYLHNLQKNNVAESFHFLLILLAVLFQYFLI